VGYPARLIGSTGWPALVAYTIKLSNATASALLDKRPGNRGASALTPHGYEIKHGAARQRAVHKKTAVHQCSIIIMLNS